MQHGNFWASRAISRRRLVGAGALGAAGLVLAACSSSNNSNNGGNAKNTAPAAGAASASSTVAATAAGTAAGTAAPSATRAAQPAGSPTQAGAASQGHKPPSGTLNVAVTALMDQSADPFYQTGGLARPIQAAAFNSFYRQADTGQPEFDLMTALEIMQDRQTLNFKLRPGLKFWDGTDVTMKDVLWSYQAYAGRTPPNPGATILKGQIDSVTAPDASTLVVKLKAPNAFGGLDIGWWPIASQAGHDKVGEDAWRQNSPMATGPYKISKNQIGQFMEFEANELFWDTPRVPYVKTVRLNLAPDQNTRMAQLQTGEADIAEGISGALAQSIASNASLKIIGSPQTAWLKINFFEAQAGHAPWTDPRLREALIISVNQDDLAKGLLREGSPSPNVQLWPKTLGYDATIFKPRAQDVARAKMLVQQAGVQGLSFTANAYDSSSYPLISQVIQAMVGFWQAIGLNPSVSQQESGGYFTKFTSRQLTGIGPNGWPFSSDAALIVVQSYVTGSPYGSTDNYKEIDAFATQISAETDHNKQIAIAQQAHKFVYDNFLFGSAPYSDSQWGANKKVTAWIRPAGDPYTTRLESVQLGS